MSKGLDATMDLTPYAGEIKAAGFEYVARYYYSGISHAKVKLSRTEALHLSSMGLYLVAVFENAGDHAEYFSNHQGVMDGSDAFAYAFHSIGQPFKTPVYFAVDYDASEQDLQSRIIPYFKGVRYTTSRNDDYFVGVYGSGFVCQRLLSLGLVSYAWLAQSTGWAEYEEFKASGKANLVQSATTVQFGVQIDPLLSNGNGGGFKCL